MITVILRKPLGIVTSFISWQRLVQQLYKAGEITPDEEVTHIHVDERGIQYYVSKATHWMPLQEPPK